MRQAVLSRPDHAPDPGPDEQEARVAARGRRALRPIRARLARVACRVAGDEEAAVAARLCADVFEGQTAPADWRRPT